MLSIEKCSKVLNKKGQNYTQKQVKDTIEFLDTFSEIILELKMSNDE